MEAIINFAKNNLLLAILAGVAILVVLIVVIIAIIEASVRHHRAKKPLPPEEDLSHYVEDAKLLNDQKDAAAKTFSIDGIKVDSSALAEDIVGAIKEDLDNKTAPATTPTPTEKKRVVKTEVYYITQPLTIGSLPQFLSLESGTTEKMTTQVVYLPVQQNVMKETATKIICIDENGVRTVKEEEIVVIGKNGLKKANTNN